MNAEQTEEALALRQTRSWAKELGEIACPSPIPHTPLVLTTWENRI